MNMRQNLMDVYNILINDEDLLRLLYYTTDEFYSMTNENDENHPFNPTRENILDKTPSEKWAIISDLIKTTNVTDGLDDKAINRICLSPGGRKPSGGSYDIARQSVFFDIYVPTAFDKIDFRESWIVDKANELLFNASLSKTIGSLGFEGGGVLSTVPLGYVGYRIVLGFEDFN